MGSSILSGDFVISNGKKQKLQSQNKKSYKVEYVRNAPLSIRLAVLSIDNFRCVFCGRSPATDVGVRLHIDHIIPFANGGKSLLEILQNSLF